MQSTLLIVSISLSFLGCATIKRTKHKFPKKSPSSLSLGSIPKRSARAIGGKQFIRNIIALSKSARETQILGQARRGNIPDFLRHLVPIKVQMKKGKSNYTAFYFVTPDYFAIGRNNDFVRIPMNPITAQRIADHYGFMLPTTKMVDQIYTAANQKLTPEPMRPGRDMTMPTYIIMHNRSIDKKIKKIKRGDLIAGHKKDIVLSNRLVKKRYRVAIYGWHRPSGKAIQPLSTIHDDKYSDYSHGLRLVHGMMVINKKLWPVAEVLQHPTLSFLLSDEGPLTRIRFVTDCF